jgi:CBS domain-containing protein
LTISPCEEKIKIILSDMEGILMDKIGAYMSSPVLTTDPGAFAYDAAREMFEHNVGALLVKDKEEYVGIFTKTDWIHKILKWEGDYKAIKVSLVMTQPVITADRNEPLAKASLLMEKNRIRHIAVTDKENLVGILSVKDLERYYRTLYDIDL